MAGPGFEPWQHGTTRARAQPLNLPDFREQTASLRSASAWQESWGGLPGGARMLLGMEQEVRVRGRQCYTERLPGCSSFRLPFCVLPEEMRSLYIV